MIGSEYSQEKQSYEQTGTTPLNLQRTAYAVFAEARAPILASSFETSAGARLALTLAGRYDHTSDFGGKATWQSGLIWRATESLSFRASYGIAYKAPELAQIEGGIHGLFPASVFGLVDPLRGNESVSSGTVEFGANTNLKPETGDSRALGLTYTSQTLHGLEASIDYFAVNIANFIAVPDLQTMINNPTLYPEASFVRRRRTDSPGPSRRLMTCTTTSVT